MRKMKPAIFVFCEGESEIEYAKYLSQKYREVVAIEKPVKADIYKAQKMFKNEPKYKDYASDIDEIWFFFDVDYEQGDAGKWDKRLKIIKQLRKLSKKAIKVRLLMTTGCIEYWLYLHFEKVQPCLKTSADKNNMLKKLQKKVPNYEKGDKKSIHQIAELSETAIVNGEWSINKLLEDSRPKGGSDDDIDEWLYKNTKSFSSVQKALVYLNTLTK